MEKQKKNNLIIAGTVAAVLLLFVMFSVLIYQLITIANAKKEKAQLQSDIVEMNQVIEESEDELEIYQSDFWLEKLARALGFKYGNDR